MKKEISLIKRIENVEADIYRLELLGILNRIFDAISFGLERTPPGKRLEQKLKLIKRTTDLWGAVLTRKIEGEEAEKIIRVFFEELSQEADPLIVNPKDLLESLRVR